MNTYLKITKALADRSRMRTVAALLRNEELCVCQLVELLQLATPTVSRHIAVLQGANLVESRKDGRWVYYKISDEFPEPLRQWFEADVMHDEGIRGDVTILEDILAAPVAALCKTQRNRKASDD